MIPGLLPKKQPARPRKSYANHLLPDLIRRTYIADYVSTAISVWGTFPNPWIAGSVDLEKLYGEVWDCVYPHLPNTRSLTGRGEIVYGNVCYHYLCIFTPTHRLDFRCSRRCTTGAPTLGPLPRMLSRNTSPTRSSLMAMLIVSTTFIGRPVKTISIHF